MGDITHCHLGAKGLLEKIFQLLCVETDTQASFCKNSILQFEVHLAYLLQ